MGVKLMLEFLICIIDTELLKTVLLENFKSENVKDTNEFEAFVLKTALYSWCRPTNFVVDALNNPGKQTLIDKFRDRVTGCNCFSGLEVDQKRFVEHRLWFHGQEIFDSAKVLKPYELSKLLSKVLWSFWDGCTCSCAGFLCIFELNIAEVQYGCNKVDNLSDLRFREAHIAHTLNCKLYFLSVINAWDGRYATLIDVVILFKGPQLILLLEFFTAQNLVEYVEIALLRKLKYNPWLF